MTELFPFRDPSLPFADRVKDLISRLTLGEKVSQMSHPAKAIPRLDIPAYNYWSESLHGIARNGRATVFPQVIGLAATWNRDLVYRIASAIGDEGRAKYHEVIRRKGTSGQYQGLTFWSPNINLFRDPRWGRGQETWGEDPVLTGEMGAAFVNGLQGDHPRYLKAAACAKHFAVHSGPEKDRHTFNAVISRNDLYNSYLPAFRKLVMEAKVEAVMGAYNRTLGEPCCASNLLLKDILRGKWGFDGHVVSDCGALSDIHATHKITRDAVESAALALKAGCDLGCDCVFDNLPEAVERGLVDESDIDQALERTLMTRFKLGLFDPPDMVPFSSTPMSVVGCESHRALARQAACQSIVLLKNKGNILPVNDQVSSIFITGPGAANIDILLGNYNGLSESLVSFVEGIVSRVPEGVKVEYRPGCQWVSPNSPSINWSIEEASSSDIAIVCLGTTPMMEGEEGESIIAESVGDRKDIDLPAVQLNFIKQLANRGAKIILVLSGGSPIGLAEVVDLVQAIVLVWYPGEEGGNALADILFGEVPPSGKLPVTFPASTSQLPCFDDYDMSQRTYRYANVEPLYPFGFGLGYTQFQYTDLSLERHEISVNQSLEVSVTVANCGKVTNEEIVQLYLSHLESSEQAPKHSLIGFQRIKLLAGERQRFDFLITSQMIGLYDLDGNFVIPTGQCRIEIGGCSPGKRGQELGAPQPLQAVFTIVSL
jgi:beta-glucosidase